jgi:DNA-directed primase/polymerase protein
LKLLCAPPLFNAGLRQLAYAALPFVEAEAARRAGGLEARARTVTFCGTDGHVTYSMIGPGSHQCDNIGRAHSSNNVYFVVDLRAGQLAQKCHDPDCCGFRSAWVPLPAEIGRLEHEGEGTREDGTKI